MLLEQPLSNMSTEPREIEKYVARGVDYWLHKKHRDKPKDAKIKYLKSKGLTLDTRAIL